MVERGQALDHHTHAILSFQARSDRHAPCHRRGTRDERPGRSGATAAGATAYGSDVQQPLTLRLDDAGRIVGVDALDAHWKAYLGRLEQVIRDMESEGKPSARGRAALAALADADQATRIG